MALLSAPRSLDEIIPSVRAQTARYGTPGRSYQVWLTEWNSVDFDPGPQTLGAVNGLFVVDYLGMLARHNIEQASYWDIHNSITPRGGDYGYLSRTGAPDGDNVPRPSYHAFKLASDALRGSLMAVSSGSDDVSAYLAQNKDTRSLVLVNKMAATKARVTMAGTGMMGEAVVITYPATNAAQKPVESKMTLKGSDVIVVPPLSAVVIRATVR